MRLKCPGYGRLSLVTSSECQQSNQEVERDGDFIWLLVQVLAEFSRFTMYSLVKYMMKYFNIHQHDKNYLQQQSCLGKNIHRGVLVWPGAI